MNKNKKFAAKGAIWAVSEDGSTTYKTIPNVGDFNIPLGEKDEIDVTTHDSPGGYEETVLGIGRYASFDIPLKWNGALAKHQFLQQAHDTDAEVKSKFTCNDGTTIEGSILVKNIEIQNPVTGALDASISLKWASKPTVTFPAVTP